jgi:hypothetical protein
LWRVMAGRGALSLFAFDEENNQLDHLQVNMYA